MSAVAVAVLPRAVSPTVQHRWFGAGSSAAADAATAGSQAAAAAVEGRDALLLVVFASVTYDLPALLAGVCRHAGPGTAVVGCSTVGQTISGGSVDALVTVAALGGSGFTARTSVGRGVAGRHRQAGEEAAACLAGTDGPYRALILLIDGLVGAQHDVVRGAYAVAGASVPMVGGCAGDDSQRVRTFQFHGTGAGVEVLTDAAVAVALASDAPLGVGTGHGWRKTGEPMVVTSSGENRVYQLDGEPALDAYLRHGGAVPDLVAADGPSVRNFPAPWPLGLSRRTGEDLRVIYGYDLADRSLLCLAEVPPGALAWLLEADTDDLVRGADQAVTEAIGMLDGAEPLGVLTFDCGIRRTRLGPVGTAGEIAQLARSAGAAPLAGCYTYGEIARTRGSRGMRHLTVVALALA